MRSKSEQKREKQFIYTLTITSLTLGAIILGDIFRSPQVYQRAPASSRQPASLAAGLAAQVAHPSKSALFAELVELNCDSTSSGETQVTASAEQLRFKGNCTGHEISVINNSNGFTASIFNAEENFSTDFIPLVQGDNSINVEIKSPQGGQVISKNYLMKR